MPESPVPSAGARVRRPGEFETHARTWMAWPHRRDLYGERLEPMQAAYTEIARAIAGFEPLAMVAHPEAAAGARRMLGAGIEVVELAIDDCWIRDSGPTFVLHGDGGLAGASWRFNAWGGKHAPYDLDNTLADRILAREGAAVIPSFLFCEGGSFACDGEGTLIVTETSILHPNRNPGVSRAWAEKELKRVLGLDHVIWLPGDPLDAETDGHVDGMCCFVRPGVVMFEYNPDPRSLHGRILADNLEVLRAARDARGRTIEVIPIPEAHDATPTSAVFARSYINFCLVNGGVILPSYGTESSAEAVAAVKAAFPDRGIVEIDVNAIAPGGGAIHCITQEQPRT